MRVSVAVLYDSGDDAFHTFGEREVPELLRRLEELELVVGFNLLRFDYRVLGAYTTADLARLPTLDIWQEVYRHLGFRLSLDALAGATLGAAKSADGLQAVAWWRQGRLEELAAYCRQDVEITLGLFRHGQEKGHLLYRRKGEDTRLRIPVDWSWPSLRRRLGRQG
jgi:DEAD/DEAH box helicase domain-containing protein